MSTIPVGYKQTEIGVIPEDWEATPLGDLFVFKNGLNKAKEFFGYGTPIVNYMDVYKYSGVYTNDLEGRVFVTNQEIKNFNVHKGDVFFTRTSETVDEIGISVVMLDEPQNTVFSGFVLRARPKNQLLNDEFKKYCFSSREVRRSIISTSSYTTRALTNGRLLSGVPLPLPSYAEQQLIATALSDTDALIESLEKLIAKKRQIKQGAMQELLSPKEGWEVKKLGEIGECIIGLTYTPANVKESGTLVLRSSNVQNSTLKYDDNVYVDSQIPEKLLNKENDILVCVRNGSRNLIGKCALINGIAVGETFGAFMSVYRSPFNKFVFHLFQFNIIKKQIDEHLGATINQITNKSLNSFEIPFPTLSEQESIATILSDMDAEITALEARLEKTRTLKSGMMYELLTGRIRLV